MFQQKELLSKDPFTFHSDHLQSTREILILKGYWLWEITAYSLYSTLGAYGIFFLNSLILLAAGTTLALQLRRLGVSSGISVPLLTLAFILLREYPLERPQVVSFLFSALLMGLLMKVRNGKRLDWKLPALMCLWANLHGGFLIGNIMLGCFFIGATIEHRNEWSRIRNLLFWSTLGVGASFLNPAGALAIVEMINFIGTPLQTGIMEYKSTWDELQQGNWIIPSIVWSLISLFIIGSLLRRKIYWPEIFVAIFLAYISIRYIRNSPFFPFSMIPTIGFLFTEFFQEGKRKYCRQISMSIVTVASLILIWLSFHQWRGNSSHTHIAPIYPQAAVDFIKKNDLRGKMFNSYEYGGYLLWQLYPEVRVFIDSRGLNPKIFTDYEKIASGSTEIIEGRNEYDYLLDYYDIDYIIQPIYDGHGNIQSLMKVVMRNSDWLPVYLDTQVYLFIRKNGENYDNLKGKIIPEEEFSRRLLVIYEYLKRRNPQEPGLLVAHAGMLIFLGHLEEASAEITALESIAPNHLALPYLRHELQLSISKGRNED